MSKTSKIMITAPLTFILVVIRMYRYYIKHLKNIDSTTLEKLDILVINSFPNSLTLEEIKKQYADTPFSVFYIIEERSIVFCSLIFSKRPTLYLYYICVPKDLQGTGVLKRALKYIKPKFSKLGYTKLALDASEEKDAYMNQKKRIQIFMNLGFKKSPLKNPSPFQTHADPKTYLDTTLGKGELVQVVDDMYIVLLNGEKKAIRLNQIRGCISDLWSDTPDICPMNMDLRKPRLTKKNMVQVGVEPTTFA